MNFTRDLIASFAFIGAFILVLCLLHVVWAREQVKKDLRRQGFGPISVRWCPLGYWAWLKETAFRAMFADSMGCIQTARCGVWFRSVRWREDNEPYLQKHLPLAGRLAYLILSLALISFGLKHLLTGKLILPSSLRQQHPRPLYLHGWTVILMSSAALCYAASLLSALVYCYHLRANERTYAFFSRAIAVLSWVLFWLSLGVYAYQFSHNPNQFYFPAP